MASPTGEALICRQPGSSLVAAFPQVTPNGVGNQNLDLIQIVNAGDGQTIQTSSPTAPTLNVDYQGNVHNPAVNPTNGTRLGVFFTRLANGSTTAAFFADAFENLLQLDILQVINPGGNISYWLDFQGVSHGS